MKQANSFQVEPKSNSIIAGATTTGLSRVAAAGKALDANSAELAMQTQFSFEDNYYQVTATNIAGNNAHSAGKPLMPSLRSHSHTPAQDKIENMGNLSPMQVRKMPNGSSQSGVGGASNGAS